MMWATILAGLETYSAEIASVTGIGVLLGWVFKPWRKSKKTDLSDETIEKIAPAQVKDGTTLTVPEFIRLRRELKADLEDELTRADETEKTRLRARITELESQIANPDAALAELQKIIKDLRAELKGSSNDPKFVAALKAFEEGRFVNADGIFAEIEARNDLAVQESARAAFGRGEVAEAELRWADAADHYVKSARLHETFAALRKASEFLGRAGRYTDAHKHSSDLVIFAKANEPQEHIANALNENAVHLKAMGQYAEAEKLFRQALDINRATIGEAHPNYAIGLNNLAMVVKAQVRLDEAETLLRQALDITRATIGDGHPDYAIRLNNLAGVVKAQGRLDEAEPLFRQALDIDRATIGEAHPDYAIRLNNLAGVIQAQGRLAEAETLFRQALDIDRATIGGGHPDYATHLHNLAVLLVKLDRPEEARPMFVQALAIFQAILPADHPNIAGVENHIANLPPAAN